MVIDGPSQFERTSVEALIVNDDWLAWIDDPSPADLEWIAQRDARDKQVGALLREGLSLHPWWSHKGPPETEEAHWSGLARNLPGLQADLILAERMRRKNESSTLAPTPD